MYVSYLKHYSGDKVRSGIRNYPPLDYWGRKWVPLRSPAEKGTKVCFLGLFLFKKNLGKMWSYLLSDFLNNFINLFLTVLILHFWMGFSLVGESGGYSSCSAWASHCSDFSYYRAWVPEHGLNIFSPLAWLLCRVWGLPRLGIELMSPALSGFWATREALAEFVCLFAIRIQYQMIFQNHEWRSECCQVPLLWGSILKSTDKADSTVLDQGKHHKGSF